MVFRRSKEEILNAPGTGTGPSMCSFSSLLSPELCLSQIPLEAPRCRASTGLSTSGRQGRGPAILGRGPGWAGGWRSRRGNGAAFPYPFAAMAFDGHLLCATMWGCKDADAVLLADVLPWKRERSSEGADLWAVGEDPEW